MRKKYYKLSDVQFRINGAKEMNYNGCWNIIRRVIIRLLLTADDFEE